jgi:transposase
VSLTGGKDAHVIPSPEVDQDLQTRGEHVRVTAVFNRLLGFSGTVVEKAVFHATGIVVNVRLRSQQLVCPCGRTSTATYDRSRRSWRHLDLGRYKVIISAVVRRVDCRGCGQVRTEWMPFARPGARHTRDFEDMAAWLARKMSKTAVATLLGTSWQTVDDLVRRLVASHVDTDRLDRLCRIGVDEIAYRKGRKFLTVVTDHDTGQVVWIRAGRSQAVLAEFFDALGPRRHQIQAVSMDMGPIYREATRAHLPGAAICFDPFHVIKWAGDALHQTFLATPRPAQPLAVEGLGASAAWRKVRGALRAGAENLDPLGEQIIDQLRRKQPRLHRAWQLKEQLRRLYRDVDPADADAYLKRWITAALKSRIRAFIALARRLRHHIDGIVAAVHLGLSNSLTEGINADIRLIQRRAHGYADLDNLIEMIYLCRGGVPTRLPNHP